MNNSRKKCGENRMINKYCNKCSIRPYVAETVSAGYYTQRRQEEERPVLLTTCSR